MGMRALTYSLSIGGLGATPVTSCVQKSGILPRYCAREYQHIMLVISLTDLNVASKIRAWTLALLTTCRIWIIERRSEGFRYDLFCLDFVGDVALFNTAVSEVIRVSTRNVIPHRSLLVSSTVHQHDVGTSAQ